MSIKKTLVYITTVVLLILICLLLFLVPRSILSREELTASSITIKVTTSTGDTSITDFDRDALLNYLSGCKLYRSGLNTGTFSGTVTFFMLIESQDRVLLLELGGSNAVFDSKSIFRCRLRDPAGFIRDVLAIVDPDEKLDHQVVF